MRKHVFWLLILGLLVGGAVSWFGLKPLTEQSADTVPTDEPTVTTPTTTDTPIPTPETKTFDEKPYAEDATFFEKTPRIEGQQNYITYPLTITVERPPILIIYSHGSNTTVTTNFKDPFMKDMRTYGHNFAKQGYAFAASAQHGANWGNAASVQDIVNTINWVKKSYSIQAKVYLLGYSMGGLPTFNFAFKYPEKVAKIALLAPTSRPESWNTSQYSKLKGIPLKLWHGDKDVNVPYSLSVSLVNELKTAKQDITFQTVKGKTHWDIDTELRTEIEKWYAE